MLFFHESNYEFVFNKYNLMRSLEFGLDTGESLHEELIRARAMIDRDALNNDFEYRNLPVRYDQLITGVEYFMNLMSANKPELAAALFKLDAFRRALYGMDSVATVQTHPSFGVMVNDYELSVLKRALEGELFSVFDIRKDNRADTFMVVNKMTAGNIMQRNSDVFDDITAANPVPYIKRTVVDPLRSGGEPAATKEYGLLSGFPRESVRRYPYFHRFRVKYLEFGDIYQKFLFHEAEANEVYDVIENLLVNDKEKTFLRRVLSMHARFSDRRAVMMGQFLMLDPADMYYAQRRQQWFRYFDSVYKPVMRNIVYY